MMKKHGVEEVLDICVAPLLFLRRPDRLPLQVVLETEFDNSAALSLYESLGFIREKRLFRFYLNGKDAFRLVLVVPPPEVDDEDDGEVIKKGLPIRFLAPARTIAIPALPYDSDDEVSSR